MTNRKNKKVIYSTFGGIILSVLLLYVFFPQKKDAPGVLNKAIINKKIIQIGNEWRKPEVEKVKECPDLFLQGKRYSSFYLKCNPDYLKCATRKMRDVEIGNVIGHPNSTEAVLSIKVSSGKYTKKVFLKLNCNEVVLPERIYGMGTYKKDKDFIWDNFNRRIFVDRFLVTNLDISYWSKDLSKISTKNKHFPSTDLTLKRMREYCQFRGKKLVSAHVLDAASFHPRDRDNKRPIPVLRGPYFWTIYKNSSFLFNSKFNDVEVKKTDCKNAYVKECKDKFGEYDQYTFSSPSWIGVFSVMGGLMEAVDNFLYAKRNLSASSYYFPAKSTWHEIGKRASWNGEGHSVRDFNFYLESIRVPPDTKIGVGFRCMRERN